MNHASGPKSIIVPKEIFYSTDQHSSKEGERGADPSMPQDYRLRAEKNIPVKKLLKP